MSYKKGDLHPSYIYMCNLLIFIFSSVHGLTYPPLRGAWRRTATIVPRSAPAGDLPASSSFVIKNMNFNYLVRNLNGQNQDPDRFRRLLRPTPEADEASSSAISFVGPWVGTW